MTAYTMLYITPAPPGPTFHGRYISTAGVVPVPGRSVLETSRRELSGDVSFGIGALVRVVVEQSTLENRQNIHSSLSPPQKKMCAFFASFYFFLFVLS